MAQPFDESTLGGRIRKSRIDTALSIQELAKKVGVSGNHLSLVERGIKNPSIPLIRKIAEATGASYSWLQYGSEVKDESPDVTLSEVDPFLVKSISMPLFLSLALQEIPGMTKSGLAGRLGVKEDAIDDILSGVSSDLPQRALSLSYIVQQMNLDIARRDLHKLDQFLQQEESRRLDILLGMLKSYVGDEYYHGASLLNKNSCPESQVPPTSTAIYQKKGSSGTITWQFKIYHYLTDSNPNLISRILTEQLTSSDNMGRNMKLTFVLCDENVFAQFRSSCKEYISENTSTENVGSHENLPDISFILVDIANRDIKEIGLPE